MRILIMPDLTFYLIEARCWLDAVEESGFRIQEIESNEEFYNKIYLHSKEIYLDKIDKMAWWRAPIYKLGWKLWVRNSYLKQINELRLRT